MTTPGRQPISAAQHELLSAYLDNQLGGVERAALERSLAGDAALRAELDELRAVRQMLRDMPALTPPRSFTLSSAQARPRRLPLFGWLRASSAVAAALLMLTFLPGLLTLGGAMAPTAAMAPTQLSAEARADAAQQRVAEATTAPAAEATTAPAAAAAEAAPPAALKASPDAAPAPMAAAEPTAAAGADAGNTAAAYAATPQAEMAMPADSTRTAMDTGGAEIGESGSSSPGTQRLDPQQPPPGRPLSPLRWAQIALAALAVALGVGALLARRAGR